MERYELPYGNPNAAIQGYGPRGIDIDRNGVVWTGVSSGHLASFDRRKCKGPLNGPNATGQHCPEGWTFYPLPGPQFKGVTESGAADSGYYNWVDQHNTLGLGANTPIAPGSEALVALNPESKQFTVLRVPYPNGFYAKLLDGRIDDPQAGWKGKGSGRPSPRKRSSTLKAERDDEQGCEVPGSSRPAREVGSPCSVPGGARLRPQAHFRSAPAGVLVERVQLRFFYASIG